MAVSINNKNGTTTKVATNVKIVKQPANHFITKAVYDPNGEVAQAGGIPEYVEGEIAEVISETPWVDTPFTKITGEQIYRYGAEGKVATGLGAHWFASEPIAVRAGQRVKFRAAGNANTTSMISSSDENGNNLLVRALAIAKDGDLRPLVDYYYDVIDDGYIVVSGTSATYEPKLYIKNPNINEKTAFDIAEIKRSNVNNELCHIFKKVVCVGDSYTAGYMSDGTASLTNKPSYSWVEHMSELTGNEWINLGITGASTKSWLTDVNGYQKAVTVGEAQAYVIGLAINDSNSSYDNYVPIGTSADIGTENDTYYGKLSKIITQLAVISPNAMFFVNTCPNWDLAIKERLPEYNQAIRDVCEHYKNTYKIHCIDLDVDYHDLYNDPSYIQNYLGSHPTAIGHAQMAKMYEYVLSDYMFKHIQVFDSIPWTDYDETPKPVVPSGGTTGQVLVKSSDADYETEWRDISNVLYGKKWCACGDSFTAGDFHGYVDPEGHTGTDSDAYDPVMGMYKTYPWWIAKRNDMNLVMRAQMGNDFTNISGATRPFSNPDSSENYTQIPSDADYVTIWFGLNEYDLTAEQIGAKGDTTNETLWGAYHVVFNSILTNNPLAKIGVFITDGAMNGGIPQAYHDALIDICKYWAIPYLDLRNGLNVPMGIGGRLDDCSSISRIKRKEAFQVSPTNLHPNVNAHKYRSTFIENFLRSL